VAACGHQRRRHDLVADRAAPLLEAIVASCWIVSLAPEVI